MSPIRRRFLASAALKRSSAPPCPFQVGAPPCKKAGGVCSLRRGDDAPVIVCPRRFDENDEIPRWLAEVVGFEKVFLAREVPFMKSPQTKKTAGRIDLVVSDDENATAWYGLEMQAVYFSGPAMKADFEKLLSDGSFAPPPPNSVETARLAILKRQEVDAATFRSRCQRCDDGAQNWLWLLIYRSSRLLVGRRQTHRMI